MAQHITRFFQIGARSLRESPKGPQSVPRPNSPGDGRRGPVDVTLLTVVGCLVSIGLVTVYSASAFDLYFSRGPDAQFHFFHRQAQGALLGALALLVASRVDYDLYRRHVYLILAAAFFLLCLTHVPGIGITWNGAARWIQLGPMRLQPAEFAKIAFVVFLAYSVSKKGQAMSRFAEAFISHAIVLAPFVFVLLLQPDLGSAVILCVLAGLLVFIGGARWSFLIGFGAAGLLLVTTAIQGASYRMDRVEAWLDPWAEAGTRGYQLVNSYVAFAQGGLTGTGFGEGSGRMGFVPELLNDFVAASIAEEFGLLGIVTLIVLYIVFVWRGTTIALRARDAFGTYLAFGLTALIALQALVNLGVVTGTLPTKGLTLPFVSYGRTSLILLLFAVGILINIGQANPNLHEERRAAREQARREQALRAKEGRVEDRRRAKRRRAAEGP
ncbi:MAG: putative lipid II flippase FtsW [Deltaproteobacteria bacterium]|nr:MAG: putative lipid II flippase FtsW [Deltaproteobacteria bacterium]